MATKNGKKGNELQVFLKNQLEEAQKRFQALEKDAEKAINGIVAKGDATLKSSRKEIEGLITRLNTTDLKLNTVLEAPAVKQFTKRAGQAGQDLRKRLDGLQSKLVEASGIASQHQVKELKGELNRLAKKIDALVGGKKANGVKSEVNAQQ
jgi:hypothetical protein